MIHHFTDSTDRKWELKKLTYGMATTIRDRYGLDVAWLADDEGVTRWWEHIQNPMTFIPSLFELCQDQAEREEVTAEQFGEALGDEAYPAAYEAFMSTVIDFFPPGRRLILMAAMGAPDKVIQNQISTWTKQRGGLQGALDVILTDIASES